MNIIEWLFSKKAHPLPTPSVGDVDSSTKKNQIRVFDGYGRECWIPRDEWKNKILPKNIRNAWDQADELYSLVCMSLEDEFYAEMVKPAERLKQIDSNQSRASVVLGIVYQKNHRLKEAERVLADHLQRHGEEGYVLTNLAKVYSEKGEQERAEATLWRALQLDPNQENGLLWFQAIYRERGGDGDANEALRRVAALPTSWRAQLWLAREALQQNNLPTARRLYEESLARAERPVPADLLMQISGDLGNHGQLADLLQLTSPYFDPSVHGLLVGNNLIKAHVELQQGREARDLLDALYALKHPDWSTTLGYWEGEIAKVIGEFGPLENPERIKVHLLALQSPIWLRESSFAARLRPKKDKDAPIVCLLGSTAEVESSTGLIERQLANMPGRMSRVIPHFLAEQTYFRTEAVAIVLMPWLASYGGGFMVSGVPWVDEDASGHALQLEPKGDYVITTHLRTVAEPWQIELRIVRAIDSKCLDYFRTTFSVESPELALHSLADQLIRFLKQNAEFSTTTPPTYYQVPKGPLFPLYLLRLEQELAVAMSCTQDVREEFLSGEREILDGCIDLCLRNATNPVPRLLLLDVLRQMKKVRPKIIDEFKDKLSLLRNDCPPPAIIAELESQALSDVFSERASPGPFDKASL